MSDAAGKPQGGLFTKALATFVADPPWAAKSFLAAGATTVAGFGAWLNDIMSPALARGGACFIGGFLIGWALRKTLMIGLLLTGSLLALIAVLKTTGWIHVDWGLLEADVTHSLAWAQGKVESVKEVLTGYLPSAGAAGAGTFFGFRKR